MKANILIIHILLSHQSQANNNNNKSLNTIVNIRTVAKDYDDSIIKQHYLDVSCYENNIKYQNSNLDIDILKNIANAEMCQFHCQETDNCNYWSWNSKNFNCERKYENGLLGGVSNENYISGPKNCNGNKPSKPSPGTGLLFTTKYYNEQCNSFGFSLE